MNEELEKEAKEWCKKKNLTSSNVGYFTSDYCEQSYLAGAEPREKQIAELSKHIVELQNDKGELIDRCRELEAQIEKMKNGDNCKYGCMACGSYLCELGLDNCNTIPFHCDKWEIVE